MHRDSEDDDSISREEVLAVIKLVEEQKNYLVNQTDLEQQLDKLIVVMETNPAILPSLPLYINVIK